MTTLHHVLLDGSPRWALRDARGATKLLDEVDFSAICGALMQREELAGALFDLDGHDVLPPTQPTKIVCVGLNYLHHAHEMNKQVPEEPLIFMKPTSALLAHGGAIELPPQSTLVHHEGELAVVIGERAKKVSKEDALGHVLGYTCANDVTARDIQRREKRYTRGKGFDTFCPLGPLLRLADGFDPAAQTVTLRVNGEVRQQSTIDDLIFKLDHIISFISHVMTLNPGDVILTGTPSGVGQLLDGDLVEVEISGIGILQNNAKNG